jgi:DNA gyrase subunit A
MRRAMAGVVDDDQTAHDDDATDANATISQERYAEMSAIENLILTITSGGQGKLSSSHDYPVRGRGGMGVTAMDKAMRGGDIVASFPVEMEDQIMLATSKGQSIRVPVDGISFRSRSAGGVRVFNTGKGEMVVSVARIADQGDEDAEDMGDAPAVEERSISTNKKPRLSAGFSFQSFGISLDKSAKFILKVAKQWRIAGRGAIGLGDQINGGHCRPMNMNILTQPCTCPADIPM